MTTAMGNILVGVPLGGVRPYASGGIGLISSRVDNPGQFFSKASSNDLGADVGGGVMFLGGNVGVRGDLRYFRSLNNSDSNGVDLSLGDFRFWRGSVGVTFKF
ncbi:MAG: outer membrane beta-barrel protein [Acidobacteria bacterium]|nr:outer membrane beta-barrel protein [Acidobacteriota bacterium]